MGSRLWSGQSGYEAIVFAFEKSAKIRYRTMHKADVP